MVIEKFPAASKIVRAVTLKKFDNAAEWDLGTTVPRKGRMKTLKFYLHKAAGDAHKLPFRFSLRKRSEFDKRLV